MGPTDPLRSDHSRQEGVSGSEGAPRPTEPGHFPPAGPNSLAAFWRRALARIGDAIIVTIPVTLIALPYVKTTGGTVDISSIPPWVLFLSVGLGALYHTAFIAWRGHTPGKYLVGVRVARLLDGGRPDLSQAALRALVPAAVAVIIPQLELLVYLSSVFNPMRRGIHDLAAGTVVVRSR